MKIDTSLFENIFPAIHQMAQRRIQIAHYADLRDGHNEEVNSWSIAEQWQLIHWHFAVSAFYYRLRRAAGPTSLVEDRASQNTEKALLQNIQLARVLADIPKLPPEKHIEGLQQSLAIAESISETLTLDIKMFLDPDGKPIDGVV